MAHPQPYQMIQIQIWAIQSKHPINLKDIYSNAPQIDSKHGIDDGFI